MIRIIYIIDQKNIQLTKWYAYIILHERYEKYYNIYNIIIFSIIKIRFFNFIIPGDIQLSS